MSLMFYACLFAGASEAEEFRLLSSWSPAYVGHAEIAQRFISQMEHRKDAIVTIRMLGPEAIPPFEQLQPAAAGLVDLLFTHGAYHVGETGIGVALDAVTADTDIRHSSGLWAMVDQQYREYGLKLLSLPTSARGYHLLLNDPITAQCDLDGRKIRGSPVYQGLIRSLAGTLVVLPASEVYAALEKHVIDGTAWPAAGSLPFRWYEVSKYYLRPTFGTTTHLILMNLKRFDGLDPTLQRALLAEGERLERVVLERFDELVTIESEEFERHGLIRTGLCGEPLRHLERVWADGVWNLALDKSGDAAERLRTLAKTAGLAQ